MVILWTDPHFFTLLHGLSHLLIIPAENQTTVWRIINFFLTQIMISLRDKAIQLFRCTFSEEPSTFAYAPGRVNFIGDHTDYCEGFVCPLAIHMGTAIAGKLVPGAVCISPPDSL